MIVLVSRIVDPSDDAIGRVTITDPKIGIERNFAYSFFTDKETKKYLFITRVRYVNENYASPTKGLFEICMGCHLRWHNKKRFPKAFCKYFIEQGNYKKLNADMKSSLKKEGLI